MLAAANHKDADSFIAVARALLDGRDLKKIPVMLDVHEQTIEAWLAAGPDGPQDENLEDLARHLEAPSPPKLEKKGELTRLLRGTGVTAESVDGLLMAIILAPRLIAPSRWIPIVLKPAIVALSEETLQRLMDLVVMRANSTIKIAGDEAQLLHKLKSMTKSGQREWAEGFLQGVESFKSSWPAKSMDPDDLVALRTMAAGADSGFSGSDLTTLALWIAARHARNRTSA
jgi:hypothetical protein